MRCVLLKVDGTKCGADLSPNQKYCRDCGGQVEIDSSKTKKCPSCSKILQQTDKFCYGCGFPFKDVAKTIICEGRNKDGTKCDSKMSTSDSFCSTCGTEQKKEEDDLDGGNDQNQTDEKNKDQTEEINKNQTEEKNKDQTEEKNKVETEEINEAIENTTQKPTFYVPSAEDDEPEKRGLAVVCSHSKFIHKTHKLQSRDSASDDHIMMKSLWKLYGCHVIDFEDEGSNFYDKELIDKIEEKLKEIENIEIFVFVLSSHGEEKEEKLIRADEQGTFQHYFFTKDGQCNTQDLMNNIATIEKLDGKLKIFVIQACRSRTGAEDKNKDYGVNLQIEGSDLSGGENDGTVHPDAKGYTPDEDEKNDESDDKRQNDGIDQSDARGYMPPEDEDEEVTQQLNVASGRTEAQGEIENEIENSIIDLPPIEVAPHCDDCVVMFASMSGKYAYSTSCSLYYSGGWLIKSVDKILKNYKIGDQPHILDILVEINREVGSRETEVKQDTGELPNLDLESEIQMEGLQLRLKNHIDKLSEIFGKHSSKDEIKKYQDELNELATKIDQNGDTEDSLNSIKKKTVDLTKKFEQELQCVTLKAQSSFFHNLAFDDKDLILCKMK